jgi:hypothetical protein
VLEPTLGTDHPEQSNVARTRDERDERHAAQTPVGGPRGSSAGGVCGAYCMAGCTGGTRRSGA